MAPFIRRSGGPLNPFRENPLLRFLGSVRMAVPMLLVLAILLAAGTVVESNYSTVVAKRFVYGTWWFGLFLSLLAVNLFCSAFSRFPWKRHQTGFVVTHLGIILVLIGSFVTQRFGTDGQIALGEGEAGHVFQEDHPVLLIESGDGSVGEVPASFTFRPPSPDRPLMLELPGGALLMVDEFLLHAGKRQVAREAHKDEKGAPALRLVLESSFVREDQWLRMSKGQDRLDLGPATAHFERLEAWKKRIARGSEAVGRNALAILLSPDGSLSYQVRRKGEFGSIEPLQTGKENPTGWMDMKFKVEGSLPSAVLEEAYEALPLPRQKDPESALHFTLVDHPDRREAWLGYQGRSSFDLKGGKVALYYGPRRGPLPFRLKLDKFTIGYDPGTQKAASYASDVTYSTGSEEAKKVISMNEPLHHMGYTLYQASYQELPDGKFASVFSVGKDPGIWLKYSGALVMVLGIAFMFWFRNPSWNKRDAENNVQGARNV
jgi:hypothetical protein